MVVQGLLLLLTVLSVVADTTLSGEGAAPRLTLGLLATIGLLWRPGAGPWLWAFVIGMVHDAADPGSLVFHGLFALLAMVVLRGLRQWLFPLSPFSAALAAAALVLIEACVLAVLVHPAGWRLLPLLGAMLTTALAAALLTMVFRPWARRQSW